ncbi:polysaccharide deacetylase family protein [Pseudolysinimonas sp.]|uniref:polysaccharide deacetylase family protein n=1 Tax=Pseudolysinimonas sp. TaxID=2680009 RepID=UPI003784B83B
MLSTTPLAAAEGEGDVCALTFDDGPNGADTAALLDLLAEHGIRAVFAVIGAQILAPGGAELLRRAVREGHVLCNHSTDFDDMGALTVDEARERMRANAAIIARVVGPDVPVPYFRAPNGSWGRTPDAAVAEGMQPLAVVNTIGDWMTQDEAVLTERLRAAMRSGELVLVHDGGGDRRGSIAAVRTVVEERLAAGWRFVLPARPARP